MYINAGIAFMDGLTCHNPSTQHTIMEILFHTKTLLRASCSWIVDAFAFMFGRICAEGTTIREILIYWLFLVFPAWVSVVVVGAPVWICCSESCECFKLSCHISTERFFFCFFPRLCLAGWSCHERMMSVTNNKTDMFTEDWRAGFIFGINFDFCRIKKCENMMQGSDCFFRKVLTLQRMLFRRKTTKQKKTQLMRHNLHLACHVWAYILSYRWQVAEHWLQASFQVSADHTFGICWRIS